MENQRSTEAIQSLEGPGTSLDGNLPSTTSGATDVQSADQPGQASAYIEPEQKRSWGKLRITAFGVAILLLLAGGGVAFSKRNNYTPSLRASNFNPVHLPLSNFASSESTAEPAEKLKINGRLEVADSAVLTPSSQPANPTAGQLYYDKTAGRLAYYNGAEFVGLQGGGTQITNQITNNNTSITNSITNNSTTQVTNLTQTTNQITNVTNQITNINGGSGTITGSGTAGAIALFSGNTAIGDSLLNQNGLAINIASLGTEGDGVGVNIGNNSGATNTVTIDAGTNTGGIQIGNSDTDHDVKIATGAGIQNVTVGSASSSSATTIQGGAGSLQLTTGAALGTTGTISIMSGNSSTTASGNVIIDTGSGIIDGTVVNNKTFEAGIEHMDPWTGTGCTTAQSFAQARTGGASLAMTGSTFCSMLENNNSPTISVVPGHSYFFSAWVKAGTTGSTITGFVDISGTHFPLTSVTDTTTGWTQMTGQGIAPAGSTFAFWSFGFNQGTVQTHYFDDVVTTDLSSASAISQLNLGTTNAQFVNIGNINQLGATTIRGSGLTLNGGVGTVAVNGGAINITGSASSALTTSAGTLTLTSAATASWGIAPAVNSNGGNLTLHAGNGSSGGNNNGGNLLLQGGLATGTGLGGGVIVKSQTDSATAFQVQNSAGQNLLNIDTLGGNINVLSANSGAVSIATGATAGASGDISITTGNSSTTASGNITIDTGTAVISGTQVGSKDFEATTNNMIPCFGFGNTVAQSSTQAHSGTRSLAVTTAAASWCTNDSEPFSIIPVVPGHNYAFSIWVRADTTSSTISAFARFSTNGFAGAGLVSQVTWGSVADVSGSWTRLTGTLVAPAGANWVGLQLSSTNASGAGVIHYIDDYTVTDLSSSSAIAALNLGATNAQMVTIGNIGQIGATSIRGSGITLAAGLGNLDISSGALTETSSAATYSTTFGALNINAAASSLWRIGTASSGAGGTLTLRAGTGGSGNNNGGDLLLQGGLATGTGSSGSVIVKPQTDSNAFQIQNSAGTSNLFIADTVNNRLGIGTASPSFRLHIKSDGDGGGLALERSAANENTAIQFKNQVGVNRAKIVYNGSDEALEFYAGAGVARQLRISTLGEATFARSTDSATALVIQNAANNALFTADTSGMNITIAGTASTFATLTLSNAHFKSTQTDAPTIGTPASCGTSPTAAVTAGSTDSAGSFTITTGTGGTSSTCDTVFTFNKTYGAPPKSILVVGKTDAASAARQVYVSAETATTFTVSFGTSASGADSTTYSFSYWVVE